MQRSRSTPLVAGAVAALALLAACGSDKSDVPTTTEAATTTTTTAAAATTTVAATTTTATTVVLIHAGDPCSVYGTSQKAGAVILYCDGETWGTNPPPSTTAAPNG